MKFSKPNILHNLMSSIFPQTIVNIKPLCKNCKYYIPFLQKCSKFGNVELVTGKKSFQHASSIRNDDKKCGNDGIYFLKNKLKFITIPYYFIKEYNSIFLPPIISISLVIYLYT
jgi:hypothetical protein